MFCEYASRSAITPGPRRSVSHPGRMNDWTEWHGAYDDPDSPLSQRLLAVQQQIRLALDRTSPGQVRLLSLCAGQGRDVLPVLASHPRGADVTGRLVELDPDLCAAARTAAPASVEVVEGDAGTTAACRGAVPADVLLLCGIFGNISDEDIARTIAAVPALLVAGGTVVWTRSTREPDVTPRLRSWFSDAGVAETAFVAAPKPGWAVGAGVLREASVPLERDRRLFSFVEA
ncbi:hypothetical protein GCM10010464_14500 [Pseudonocardia yunnanensis]